MKKSIINITLGYWFCIAGALLVQYLYMHEVKDFSTKMVWILGAYLVFLVAGVILGKVRKTNKEV